MKKTFLTVILSSMVSAAVAQDRIVLTEQTLMHEMRATPYPLSGAVVADRKVSFQWPMEAALNVQEPLDGFQKNAKVDKKRLQYIIRYSQDPSFRKGVTTVRTRWPFYNPDQDLSSGEWYWQYGYVHKNQQKLSERLHFTVRDNSRKFCPPSWKTVVARIPAGHPRIWVEKNKWQEFRQRSKGTTEASWYIGKANEVLKEQMLSVSDINTSKVKKLTNQVQIKAYLTRESRRIIDKEEADCRALIGAYLLTADRRYATEALHRVLTMVNWDKDPNVKGDFNDATLLSLSTMAYDSFYGILSAKERQALLGAIADKAGKMYDKYNNHLENHIADNHVWQMTFRILTMAAFATYGELPQSALWADYCYNLWVARFPGLNADGAWHNGDSYFSVNIRTLVEVPWFYSRLSGFDFFKDPWYQGNVMYTIFQQPPFSKSGGNGSSHLKVVTPSAGRVGYLDALARLTGNTYAADFVRRTLSQTPNYLKKAFLNKPGDLSWFRLQCGKPLPEGPGLASLPEGYVFPSTGLASFMTDWNDPRQNAMWSFRSSPYGSTSHALANQNAFNTFYGGLPLFYSSGHHTSFVDRHSIYCHRGTRAHNTILADGMGQRIGTEGYGWIPRSYVGRQVGYVLGDASNAYGEVISPLWLERGRLADVEFSPATGWDKNHVKTYRRHMVDLGASGLLFVYDELEADTAIAWHYLLHTVLQPIEMDSLPGLVHVRASNEYGFSDAYLLASTPLKTSVTDQFFYPAVNWLKGDAKGKFAPNANHWHFTAISPKRRVYRYATIIDTHSRQSATRVPVFMGDGKIKVGDWMIDMNLTSDGKAAFHVTNSSTGAAVRYDGGATEIVDGQVKETLTDQFPALEI